MDHLHYVCLVFVMLSRLFIAALWPPAWKGLTPWLLLVMFIVFCYFLMWYPGSDVVLDCIAAFLFFVLTLRRIVLTRTFQRQVPSTLLAIHMHINRTGHPKEASRALFVCHAGNDRGKSMA